MLCVWYVIWSLRRVGWSDWTAGTCIIARAFNSGGKSVTNVQFVAGIIPDCSVNLKFDNSSKSTRSQNTSF